MRKYKGCINHSTILITNSFHIEKVWNIRIRNRCFWKTSPYFCSPLKIRRFFSCAQNDFVFGIVICIVFLYLGYSACYTFFLSLNFFLIFFSQFYFFLSLGYVKGIRSNLCWAYGITYDELFSNLALAMAKASTSRLTRFLKLKKNTNKWKDYFLPVYEIDTDDLIYEYQKVDNILSRISNTCMPKVRVISSQIYGDQTVRGELNSYVNYIETTISTFKKTEYFDLKGIDKNVRQDISSSTTVIARDKPIFEFSGKGYKKLYNPYVEAIVRNSQHTKIRERFFVERKKLRQLVDNFISQETETLEACNKLLTDRDTPKIELLYKAMKKIETSDERFSSVQGQYRNLKKVTDDFDHNRSDVVFNLLTTIPYPQKDELLPPVTTPRVDHEPEYKPKVYKPKEGYLGDPYLSNLGIASIFV